MDSRIDLARFESGMRDAKMSKNAVASYLYAGKVFDKQFGDVTRQNLDAYKTWLIENFAVKTVNIRLLALNWYAKHVLKNQRLWTPLIKEQQKPFLEDVISEADYEYLKRRLENEKDRKWYFIVRFLGATGARISEFLQFKVEHVRAGKVDIYGKGGKLRRVYIPAALRDMALAWLDDIGRESGFLWLNQNGERMTARGIAAGLKDRAKKYKMNPDVVYPHSFRHRFAKSFLERYSDIAFLADLMGHASIETTRIYLRKTATEQREIVDRVITW